MDHTLMLTPTVRDYIVEHATREHPALAACREATAKLPNHVMQISPDQGALMSMLVRISQATHIIEIGTFTGYSALAMALALPDEGELIALDSNADYTELAKTFWAQAGVSDKIELRIDDAHVTMAELADKRPGEFDMIFLDANKLAYPAYYNYALTLLRTGGLIAIDNTLQNGRVADTPPKDKIAKAMDAFNRMLHQDDRIELCLVPVGDGLTLAYKSN
jgi:predicted O-methyltransferase YrrM